MADITISGLSEGIPSKNSAIIPYSDGTTTLKTSPSGIVAASPGALLQVININNGITAGITIGPTIETNTSVMQLSIRPRFNTSRVLIDCGIMLHRETGSSLNYYNITLWRDSTGLATIADAALYQSLGNGARDFYSTSYLDTPNTTNNITYYVKSSKLVLNDSATCTACYNGICYISLKEIAG